ncbi:IS200/IS605 family transposase [Alishewanella sp. 16-MA]|uniref:IS200/IS605 family transposase n=1 Tax=Alishewanella maricola TaxID=2795740 RepID=A0ABS8C145_9ALTE|nr:IS200/IS605 family transposase [Alishewanella maricola]
MPWLTTRASKSKQLIHLVFVSKYRRPALTGTMLKHCEAIFKEQCKKQNVFLHEFNGDSDHVHILVQIPPTISLSLLVKLLKGNASLQLRKQFWPEIKRYLWSKHFWSPSYCAVSFGGASIDTIRKYIENQDRPT